MSRSIFVQEILQQDLISIQQEDEDYEKLKLETFDVPNSSLKYWTMVIHGAKNSYWHGQIYDVVIKFSRQHPFEVPTILFPLTNNNKLSIRHPFLQPDSTLQSGILDKDTWTCTTRVIEIINYLRKLFTDTPYYLKESINCSKIESLSEEVLQHVSSYISLKDYLSLASTCKKFLSIFYSESFWADIYYNRCNLSNTLLYTMNKAGPLRVYSASGKWHWEESRESFIRTYECNLFTSNSVSMESFLLEEISSLTMLSYPLPFSGAVSIIDTGTTLLTTSDANNTVEAKIKFLKMLRYRLRRISRLARFLVGDDKLRQSIRNVSNTIPTTMILFLSSMLMEGLITESQMNEYVTHIFCINSKYIVADINTNINNADDDHHHDNDNNNYDDDYNNNNNNNNNNFKDKYIFRNQDNYTDNEKLFYSWKIIKHESEVLRIRNKENLDDFLINKVIRNKHLYTPNGDDDDYDLVEVQNSLKVLHFCDEISYPGAILKTELARSNEKETLLSDYKKIGNNHSTSFIPINERLQYGPDIYDFLELYHESHIVYSYSMKDYQIGSIVDCMDKHGNWLGASVKDTKSSKILNHLNGNLYNSTSNNPFTNKILSPTKYQLDNREIVRHNRLLNSQEFLNNRNNNTDYKDYLDSKVPSSSSSSSSSSFLTSSSYLQKYQPTKMEMDEKIVHPSINDSTLSGLDYDRQELNEIHRSDQMYNHFINIGLKVMKPCSNDVISISLQSDDMITIPLDNNILDPDISIKLNDVNGNDSIDVMINNDNEFNIDDDTDIFSINNENNIEKDVGNLIKNTSISSISIANSSSTAVNKYIPASNSDKIDLNIIGDSENESMILLHNLNNTTLSSRSISNSSNDSNTSTTSSTKRKSLFISQSSDDENALDALINLDIEHPAYLSDDSNLPILYKKNNTKMYLEENRNIDEDDYDMNYIFQNDIIEQRSHQSIITLSDSSPSLSSSSNKNLSFNDSRSNFTTARPLFTNDKYLIEDNRHCTPLNSKEFERRNDEHYNQDYLRQIRDRDYRQESQQFNTNQITPIISIPTTDTKTTSLAAVLIDSTANNNTSMHCISSNVISNPSEIPLTTSITAPQSVAPTATTATAPPINTIATSSRSNIFDLSSNNLPSQTTVPSKSSAYYLEHNLLTLSEIFPYLIKCLLKEEVVQTRHFNYLQRLFDEGGVVEDIDNNINMDDINEVAINNNVPVENIINNSDDENNMIITRASFDIKKINLKQAIIEKISFKVALVAENYVGTTFTDREIRDINDVDYTNNVNNNVIINNTPMFRTPVVLSLSISEIPPPPSDVLLLPHGRCLFRESYASNELLTNLAIRTINNQRYNSYNNNFNLNRSYLLNRLSSIHYIGYDARFDEIVTSNSWRLKPFRLNSSRPISIPILRVNEIIKSTGLNNISPIESACSDAIEIKLRCFWLMNKPGCGYLRLKVPITITIEELIVEYCNITKISCIRCNACIINMEEAVQYAINRRSGIRDHPYPKNNITSHSANTSTNNNSKSKFNKSYLDSPGIKHLNSLLTLKTCQIIDDDTIDILYNPVDFVE